MNSNSTDLSPKELRSFGLILSCLMFLFMAWWTTSWAWPYSALPLTIAIVAIVYPKALKPIHGPWMFFGGKIAQINITIFLSLIYFLIFTPLAFIFKLTGRDVLKLKKVSDQNTYWEDYDSHESSLERYRRLF